MGSVSGAAADGGSSGGVRARLCPALLRAQVQELAPFRSGAVSSVPFRSGLVNFGGEDETDDSKVPL